MADEHVVDVKGDGSWAVDQIARDRLEEVVLGVEPPGPSLVPASGEVSLLSYCCCCCGGVRFRC